VLVGFILLLYLVFLGLMTVTEQRWLGSPPFHPAIDVVSLEPHELTLVDGGAESLAIRLQLIKQAQKTLDLEFFIYDLDAASRIVAQALAERARAGVQVRVLVDFSLPVFQLRPQYAKELAAAGVEVRYYNTSSVARFFSVQHRTHRKMLLSDAKAAMVGGRNIADDYFDLGRCRRALISTGLHPGPGVGMSHRTRKNFLPSRCWTQSPKMRRWWPESRRCLWICPAILALTCVLSRTIRGLDFKTVACSKPSPKFWPGRSSRYWRKAHILCCAIIPYSVPRDDRVDVLRCITERGVHVGVLTNSLHSTDAYYTVSPLYFSLRSLALENFELFAYSGSAPEVRAQFPGSKRWGVHSKRAVVDDSTIMIGTYNIDPRSANLNSELIVVCRDSQALATQMRQSIESRLQGSQVVIAEQAVNSSHLIGDASLRSLLLMGIVTPVASLFNFLL